MMQRGKVFWFEYRSQYAMENYHIALGSLANRTYGLTMPDPAGGIKCLVEVMVLFKDFKISQNIAIPIKFIKSQS